MNLPKKLLRVLLLSVATASLVGCFALPQQPSQPPVLSQRPKLGPEPANVAAIDPAPSSDILGKLDNYLLDLQTFQKKLAASLRDGTVR